MDYYYIAYDLGRGNKFIYNISDDKFIPENKIVKKIDTKPWNASPYFSKNQTQYWQKALNNVNKKMKDKSGQLSLYSLDSDSDLFNNKHELIKTMDTSYLKKSFSTMRKIARFISAKKGYYIFQEAQTGHGVIKQYLQPDNKVYSAVAKGFYFNTAQEAK